MVVADLVAASTVDSAADIMVADSGAYTTAASDIRRPGISSIHPE